MCVCVCVHSHTFINKTGNFDRHVEIYIYIYQTKKNQQLNEKGKTAFTFNQISDYLFIIFTSKCNHYVVLHYKFEHMFLIHSTYISNT